MKYDCPLYVALRDFEYQGGHVWCKVEKWEKRYWFDYMVMRFPEIFRRIK
jgi:hypothetical protein